MALLDKTQLNYVGGVSQLTDINMIQNQAKESINNIVSVKSGGIRKRNSLELFSETNYIKDNAYIYDIDRTDAEKYIVVVNDNGSVLAFDKQGNPFPVIMNDSESVGYLTCDDPKTQIRHVVVNDTSYLVNRNAVVTMSDDLTPINYNQAIVWIKNVDYGKTFEIIVNGNVVATHETPDGDTPENVALVTTDVVAESLLTQLEASSLDFDFDIVNGSTILLSNRNLTAKWTLETKDGMGGSGISVIKDKINTDAELPPQCFDLFKVKVDGDPLTSEGDYFYIFDVEGGTNKGEGSWEETTDAQIQYKIETYSMPQKLVSYQDRFELEPVEWFDRLVGDDTTNPFPTFIDQRINDMFLFSNRIGFLSADSIILSEHDVYTNFFKSSIRATLETDYIDVTASTTELNILRHAVVFNNELVVNSDKHFFSLGFSGNNISNANASLRNFGTYATSPKLKPQKKGTSIYYINDVNDNARMYELFVNNYNSSDIREVSFMVPEYMPKDLDLFYCKPDSDIFLMNKTGDRDIYVYQEVKNAGKMVVSAFHKWQLSEGAEIIGVVDVDNSIIVLVNYNNFTRLYSLNLSETHYDEGFEYHNYLDFKQNQDNVSTTFNDYERRTEITMNNTLSPENITVVITEESGDLVRGEVLYCTGALANIYYFDKDLTGAKFIIGERYEQFHKHGTFYSPNKDGTNRTQGKTMISTHEVFFEDTGYVEIDTVFKNRNNRLQTVKQGIVTFGKAGSDKLNEQNLVTGSRRYGITNINTDTEISYRNNSHLPCNLIRCDYVFRYWGKTNGI